MSAQLKLRGYHVGRRKARQYMNEMDIYPIYPKMNLSKRMQQSKVCPYLHRNAVIDAPNQAWSIDITYIPIRHGFLYLTAVIDWYSRCIVGWEVDDTLDTRMVINALKKAGSVASSMKNLILHNTIISRKLELLSDNISTLTILNDAILPLIVKLRLNATIRQCFCHMWFNAYTDLESIRYNLPYPYLLVSSDGWYLYALQLQKCTGI